MTLVKSERPLQETEPVHLTAMVFLGLVLVGAWAVPGCRGDTPVPRVAVFGTVQRAGVPVARGSISFLPEQGLRGPAANTVIRDGRYKFTESTGPSPGPHRVLIIMTPDGKPDTNSMVGQFKAKGPPPDKRRGGQAGRTRWEFHVVVPSEPEYEKNFALD